MIKRFNYLRLITTPKQSVVGESIVFLHGLLQFGGHGFYFSESQKYRTKCQKWALLSSIIFKTHLWDPNVKGVRLTVDHRNPDKRWQVVSDYRAVSGTCSKPTSSLWISTKGTTEQTAEGNTFRGRKPGSPRVPILVSHCVPWFLKSVLM